ncbi:MAG: hypothetical protein ACE5MI_13750 [Acidimicrobiia bacterium]
MPVADHPAIHLDWVRSLDGTEEAAPAGYQGAHPNIGDPQVYRGEGVVESLVPIVDKEMAARIALEG